MTRRLPEARAAYRGPVLVDPARADEGVDLSAVTHTERRARHRRTEPLPLPPRSRADWVDLLVTVALVLAFLSIIIPGLAWLADGAPDRRPPATEAPR